MSESRYVVGIDLGTTHSVLSYIDTRQEVPNVVVLDIPQIVGPGTVGDKPLLPSFLYFGHEGEPEFTLPWAKGARACVGDYARSRGVETPMRVISSAKSWLSHPSIDRRAGMLPLGAPEDIEKISPVEVSFRYLEHIVLAFNNAMKKIDPGQKLEDQDVVLTVPASFDPAARELTVEAAMAAGLENVTLLEEPQASLYAWTLSMGEAWRKKLTVGDVLLVVDVGGGTTDFSVISVRERAGSVELERVCVGDHILLGGDNMDLLLGHLAKTKLEKEQKAVDHAQSAALVASARSAKELLLSQNDVTSAPIAVASRGSKLVGGTLRTELSRNEVEKIIVEGFFPIVEHNAAPEARTRSGLAQFGLPYAQDAAVTKHLAQFLTRHTKAVQGNTGPILKPTAILFNGGVMKSDALRKRVVKCVNEWVKENKGEPTRVLDGADYDLSVAKGAAYYGLARRGKGLRIRGGTSKAYYVGIEGTMPAVPGLEPPLTLLCVAPIGMEEGTQAELVADGFGVVVGEPVSFRFLASSIRKTDVAGTALPQWTKTEFEEVSPLRMTLQSESRKKGDIVPVKLVSRVTEIGTMEIHAVPLKPSTNAERWKIELSLREKGDK